MNKLAKGIKKKVKGKHKPTEEELEQDELRKYRLEKQKQLQENSTGASDSGASASNPEKTALQHQDQPKSDSDEWAKFRALTAGVDSVLTSTKDSLQHIKETSYFQRKTTQVDNKQQIDDKADQSESVSPDYKCEARNESDENKNESPVNSEEVAEDKSPDCVDVRELISQVEEFERGEALEEDIFNTEYVDKVTSGEVQLAEIPDSPTDKNSEDPFDTTAVEAVIQLDNKANKHKNISLGGVVAILSGAKNEITTVSNSDGSQSSQVNRRERGRYRRPGSIDLIGDSSVNNLVQAESTANIPDSPGLTILDQEPELDIPTSLPEPQKVIQAESECFDTLNEPDVDIAISSDEILHDIVSEFDTPLSLSTAACGDTLDTFEPEVINEEDSEFDHIANESLLREKDRLEILGSESDPFDTSCASGLVQTETCEEPKDATEDVAGFDAKFGDEYLLISETGEFEQKVYGIDPETAEHQLIVSSPSVATEPSHALEVSTPVDPFDTSAAEVLTAYEIRQLESKLTEPAEGKDTIGKSEKAFGQIPEVITVEKSTNVEASASRIIDLLIHETKQDSTPVVEPQAVLPAQISEEIDPFDTTIADQFGAEELKALETEFLDNSDTGIEEPTYTIAKSKPAIAVPSPLSLPISTCVPTKIHTSGLVGHLSISPEDILPTVELHPEPVEEVVSICSDPFDTSIADKIGVQEIKLIECELKTAKNIDHSESDTSFSEPSISEKIVSSDNSVAKNLLSTDFDDNQDVNSVLEPRKPSIDNSTEGTVVAESIEVDPFDTSFACKLGNTELYALESELITEQITIPEPKDLILKLTNKHQQSESKPESQPQDILASTPCAEAGDVLTPISLHNQTYTSQYYAPEGNKLDDNADPFDTSIAENYSEAELRVLEKEFVDSSERQVVHAPTLSLSIGENQNHTLLQSELTSATKEVAWQGRSQPDSIGNPQLLESSNEFNVCGSPEKEILSSCEDPFDTSFVADKVLH